MYILDILFLFDYTSLLHLYRLLVRFVTLKALAFWRQLCWIFCYSFPPFHVSTSKQYWIFWYSDHIIIIWVPVNIVFKTFSLRGNYSNCSILISLYVSTILFSFNLWINFVLNIVSCICSVGGVSWTTKH